MYLYRVTNYKAMCVHISHRVKGEKRPGSLQTVASQFQLVHCVHCSNICIHRNMNVCMSMPITITTEAMGWIQIIYHSPRGTWQRVHQVHLRSYTWNPHDIHKATNHTTITTCKCLSFCASRKIYIFCSSSSHRSETMHHKWQSFRMCDRQETHVCMHTENIVLTSLMTGSLSFLSILESEG